ncbi:hypothetical protein PL321_07105 [Caloramator sp. mosi_1]|nr:hypothetical protein [Caloramator sp. mosi_1]WDC85222.1 hypothetical protein PL321_07105 [Caloramator sp. mosi_1]
MYNLIRRECTYEKSKKIFRLILVVLLLKTNSALAYTNNVILPEIASGKI